MLKYYIFAAFIFLMIICIMIVYRRLFGKSQSDKTRDEKLLQLYRQMSDMIDGFDQHAEELKKDLLCEKDKIVSDLDDYIADLDDKVKEIVEIKLQTSSSLKTTRRSKSSSEKKLSNSDMIRKLYDEGQDIATIAKKMKLNVSEIELIIDSKS